MPYAVMNHAEDEGERSEPECDALPDFVHLPALVTLFAAYISEFTCRT